MYGKLITIFGIDGSGKSTVIEKIREFQLKNTICMDLTDDLIITKELENAEKLLNFNKKDIFSSGFIHSMHIVDIALRLFSTVMPLLEKGTNVIINRYSICMQVHSELFVDKTFHCLSKILECFPRPDLGIYLNVDIDIAVDRIKQRIHETGKPITPRESREWLILKKEKYDFFIGSENYNIVEINANQEAKDVFIKTLDLLKKTI